MVVPEKKKQQCLSLSNIERRGLFLLWGKYGAWNPFLPDKGNGFTLPLWTNLLYLKPDPYITTTCWEFQHQEMRMVLSESSSQLDHTWIILSIVILRRVLSPPAAQDTGTLTKYKQQITSCFSFVHSSAFSFKTDRKITAQWFITCLLLYMKSKTVIWKWAL